MIFISHLFFYSCILCLSSILHIIFLRIFFKFYKQPNDFDSWLKVLTVFKNLNKWDIFDSWSSKSKNYDKNNNISLWNNNEGIIDINYLVFVINETSTKKLEYFSSYKPYHPIVTDISNITQLFITEFNYLFYFIPNSIMAFLRKLG